MYSRGFRTQFFTGYFLQGPAVEVAQVRYPRQEAAESLQVHPAVEVAAQAYPRGRRELYRRQ